MSDIKYFREPIYKTHYDLNIELGRHGAFNGYGLFEIIKNIISIDHPTLSIYYLGGNVTCEKYFTEQEAMNISNMLSIVLEKGDD